MIRKIVGIFLILVGIVVCIVGISMHTAAMYNRYQGFAEHGYYDSFLHYYWAVGKANTVFSVLCGGIPAGFGVCILRWKWESIW